MIRYELSTQQQIQRHITNVRKNANADACFHRGRPPTRPASPRQPFYAETPHWNSFRRYLHQNIYMRDMFLTFTVLLEYFKRDSGSQSSAYNVFSSRFKFRRKNGRGVLIITPTGINSTNIRRPVESLVFIQNQYLILFSFTFIGSSSLVQL